MTLLVLAYLVPSFSQVLKLDRSKRDLMFDQDIEVASASESYPPPVSVSEELDDGGGTNFFRSEREYT